MIILIINQVVNICIFLYLIYDIYIMFYICIVFNILENVLYYIIQFI